jgi:hypothetical protein
MIVRGFKKFCVSDEMVGRDDVGGVKNVGSEHGSVGSECETEDWNCKSTHL